MKKRLLAILLIIFSVCVCCGLAACGQERMDEVIKNNGYKLTVTLDAGEGKFNDTQSSTRTLFVKPDSKIPYPGYSDMLYTIPECTLAKHKVEGWFYGEKNAETGEISYGREFSFKTDKITEDVTLYAKWQRRAVYSVMVNGEEAATYFVDEDKLQSLGSFALQDPKWEGHTFMGYVDEKGAAYDLNAPYPSDGRKDVFVYTRFIEGEYKLVYTAKDFIDGMSATNVSQNFYLMNDIDLAGQTWFGPSIFSGIIQGNGYTVRNLYYGFESDSSRISDIGLFGQLGIASRAAEIKNVRFENVKLNVTLKNNLRSDCNIGLLCGTVANLKIENVEFADCAVTFTEGSLEKASYRGLSVQSPYYYGFVSAGTGNLVSDGITGIIVHPAEWDGNI